MIEDQVQEVLDLLNSELHGRVDYALFSKIFDAVGSIDTPKGYVVVPVDKLMDCLYQISDRSYVDDNVSEIKAMLEAVEK